MLDADGTITCVDDDGGMADMAHRANRIARGAPGVSGRPAAEHRGFDDH